MHIPETSSERAGLCHKIFIRRNVIAYLFFLYTQLHCTVFSVVIVGSPSSKTAGFGLWFPVLRRRVGRRRNERVGTKKRRFSAASVATYHVMRSRDIHRRCHCLGCAAGRRGTSRGATGAGEDIR